MLKINFIIGFILVLLFNLSDQKDVSNRHKILKDSIDNTKYDELNDVLGSRLPCITGYSYWLSNVGVWAYTEVLTYGVTNNSHCEFICYLSVMDTIGWTRLKSANACYCFNQPFGIDGGTVSASLSSDWDSGFFRNELITKCGNYIVSDQRIWFSSYFSPGDTDTPEDCANWCYSYSYSVWTRAYDSHQCFCGNQNFDSSLMTFDSNWSSGFSFF